ncbi:GNAT family N-acetyltransferase [Photobacterium halotolerans]|uniref:Acetyltransferase n=1 Tax=Photobacterium halotolerans TaxID=265726 RepID=A0A0F5V967_9GAMM|nr:GNAT family N-acetyltransferase [Photobacterium halotolerans]KKC98607.1 acetyltransferase [Photobacterium halotolerans]
MDKKEIMALYNQFERIGQTALGYEKQVNGSVIRCVSPEFQGSYITYFHLDEAQVISAIKKEIHFFSEQKKSFEWKTYSTDSPANIGKHLIEQGFSREDSESFMVLELDSIQGSLPVTAEITEVADLDGIREAMSVQEKVWGTDHTSHAFHLHQMKQASPEDVAVYVIYDHHIPVSSAWILYSADSPFAGIWGGSTLSEYRCKGYYTALLHQRMNDARQRGIRYLTIDASAMSRPIVEKHGFRFIAETTPYFLEANG